MYRSWQSCRQGSRLESHSPMDRAGGQLRLCLGLWAMNGSASSSTGQFNFHGQIRTVHVMVNGTPAGTTWLSVGRLIGLPLGFDPTGS